MDYLSVKDLAVKWDLSERMVRRYCEEGRVEGAFMENNRWLIPVHLPKPQRLPSPPKISSDLKQRLKGEKDRMILGGIYHYLMTDFTYSSCAMDGGSLSLSQVKEIFENNRLNTFGESVKVDDIIEVSNHFRCIDMMIDHCDSVLNQETIKQLHVILKVCTSVSWNPWYQVGEYTSGILGLGGNEDITDRMRKLVNSYNRKKEKTLEDIVDLFAGMIRIHPFRDSNGRIARLIAFKECLKNNYLPFIIDTDTRDDFNGALIQYELDPSLLMEVCVASQEKLKAVLDGFGIIYD